MFRFINKVLCRIRGRDYQSEGVLMPSKKRVSQYRDHMVVGKNVLEIGTGSGVLAKMALEKGAKSVLAVDINPAAVRMASKNVPGAKVVHSDLFENVDEKFDSIIFAAPWSVGEIRNDYHHALYDTGVVRRFLREAKDYLDDGGDIWIQYCDAFPENNQKFLSDIEGEDYEISGRWSYESWGNLVKRNVNVTLYRLKAR